MKQPLVSFAGNHIGDDPRFGNVFDYFIKPPLTDWLPPVGVGTNTLKQSVNSDPGLSGTVDQWMRFTPINEPGIANANNASLVFPTVNPQAGLQPIIGLPNGTATPGFYRDVVNGIPMIRLDCERSIMVAFTGASFGSCTVTVTGADMWGQMMTASTVFVNPQLVGYYEVGDDSDVARTPPYTQKCFSYVQSVRLSTALGGGVTMWVGVGNTFGFEYYCSDLSDLVRINIDGVERPLILASAVVGAINGMIVPPQPAIYQTVPVAAGQALGNFYWLTPSATTGASVRGAYKWDSPGGNLPVANGGLFNIQYKSIGASPYAAYLYSPQSTVLNRNGGGWSDTASALRTGYVIGPPQYYNPALA